MRLLSAIPPFNGNKINLKIGSCYELCARDGYYFFNCGVDNKNIIIKNGTILLLYNFIKNYNNATYNFYFYSETKILIYSVDMSVNSYNCNFIEII